NSFIGGLIAGVVLIDFRTLHIAACRPAIGPVQLVPNGLPLALGTQVTVGAGTTLVGTGLGVLAPEAELEAQFVAVVDRPVKAEIGIAPQVTGIAACDAVLVAIEHTGVEA